MRIIHLEYVGVFYQPTDPSHISPKEGIVRFAKPIALTLACGLLLFGATAVQAQVTFFGEDLDPTSSMINSTTAESDFLSSLIGVGTEDFESFADGQAGPIGLTFPGAGSATLDGTGNILDEASACCGRFAISGSKFWSVDVTSGSFFIDFTDPVAAFGFYGTDVGDFAGQLSLELLTGTGTTVVEVPHSVENGIDPEGAAFFFGYINTTSPFTRVDFTASGGYGNETFGFDDMTIGSVEQVAVPEPGTLILLGSGLLGIGVVARRRRENEGAAA